jgi:hypothetical protein
MEGDNRHLKIAFLLKISGFMTEFIYTSDSEEVRDALRVIRSGSAYNIMKILNKEGGMTKEELRKKSVMRSVSITLNRMLEVGIIDQIGSVYFKETGDGKCTVSFGSDKEYVYSVSLFGKDMFEDYDPKKKDFRHKDIPCV